MEVCPKAVNKHNSSGRSEVNCFLPVCCMRKAQRLFKNKNHYLKSTQQIITQSCISLHPSGAVSKRNFSLRRAEPPSAVQYLTETVCPAAHQAELTKKASVQPTTEGDERTNIFGTIKSARMNTCSWQSQDSFQFYTKYTHIHPMFCNLNLKELCIQADIDSGTWYKGRKEKRKNTITIKGHLHQN